MNVARNDRKAFQVVAKALQRIDKRPVYQGGMAWNLRVSAALHQGDRIYMEDHYAIHYECCKESGQFLYAYFGVFDGHGGCDAAKYAKDNLHRNIIENPLFWGDETDVIKAIEGGFEQTHIDMWKELPKWPKTSMGLPSTAGTTASIVIIKGNRIYTGHVGDSGIALGTLKYHGGSKCYFLAEQLTLEHKPDSPVERSRIESVGGCVQSKAGVPRVVWNRPRDIGPVRRSTPVDKIPFLAVARSLGDLWSYNFETNRYVVDFHPDVSVRVLDTRVHKCLILATDGLWNLLNTEAAVAAVEMTERTLFREYLNKTSLRAEEHDFHHYHHASTLVNMGLRRWRARGLRADNTSAIVVLIDPPRHPIHSVLARVANDLQQKETLQLPSETEKYIVAMTTLSEKQASQDERFHIHKGQPVVRHNVPKGTDVSLGDSSITLYDVIIHKTLTPSKMPHLALFPNIIRRPVTELKRFRPLSSQRSLSTTSGSPSENRLVCSDVDPTAAWLCTDEVESHAHNLLNKFANRSASTTSQSQKLGDDSRSDCGIEESRGSLCENLLTHIMEPQHPTRKRSAFAASVASQYNGSNCFRPVRNLAGTSYATGRRPLETALSRALTRRPVSGLGLRRCRVNSLLVKAKRTTVRLSKTRKAYTFSSTSRYLNRLKRKRLSSPLVALTRVREISIQPALT